MLLLASLFAILSPQQSHRKSLEKLGERENQIVQSSRRNLKTDVQTHQLLIGNRMNINTASVEELSIVPGIGDIMAKRIVEWRNNRETSEIQSLTELEKIRGVGPKKRRILEQYFRVYAR